MERGKTFIVIALGVAVLVAMGLQVFARGPKLDKAAQVQAPVVFCEIHGQTTAGISISHPDIGNRLYCLLCFNELLSKNCCPLLTAEQMEKVKILREIQAKEKAPE